LGIERDEKIMQILISEKRGDLLQLIIRVMPDEDQSYRVDDNCGFLSVKTHQSALDSAARYLNHGHIWHTKYDQAVELPSLLRVQA
jgi:hypothetical protein